LINTPWTAEAVRDEVNFMEDLLPAHATPNYVLNNHDQPRLASRVGVEQTRVAGMLLLTLRGTPTLYMGEEIGMVNGDIKPEQVRDPQGIRMGVEVTRDVCRTPIQWDASENAGFGTGETWLPVNADYQTRNVAAQSQDAHSVLSLYRRLIWMRKHSPALLDGEYYPSDAPAGVFAYTRSADGEKLLIVLNFTGEAKTVTLPSAGEIVLNTMLNREGAVSGTLELAAHEGVIVQLS
jgi:alpha-glucosidase